MTLVEYDCTESTAIERIAVNKIKKELIAIWRGSVDVYLYTEFEIDLFKFIVKSLEKGHQSIGQLVNRIKQHTTVRKVSEFPSNTIMFVNKDKINRLLEFDCSNSDAIHRIALNLNKSEMVVIWKGGPHVYLYFEIKPVLFNQVLVTLKEGDVSLSYGNLMNSIKGHTKVRKIREFAHSTVMYKVSDHVSNDGDDSNNNHTNYPQQSSQHQSSYAQPPLASGISFSKQWLNVCQDMVSFNIAYFRQCIARLESMIQDIPPSHPPPLFHYQNSKANHTTRESNNGNSYGYDQAHVNAYESLFSGGNGNSTNENLRAVKSNFMSDEMQTRYIVVHFKGSLADLYRLEANASHKKLHYPQMAELWSEAFEILNTCLIETDPWSALLFDDKFNGNYGGHKNNHNLPDNHNFEDLDSTIDALTFLTDDTQLHKVRAIDFLNSDLEKESRKLNPMLQDRNHVKQKIGEDRWCGNARPKRDFADVRLPLERIVKEIKEAIAKIQSLHLINEFN